MKILAVDTSATAASVCLATEDKILGEFYTNTALTHSQTLVPMAEQVLKTTRTDMDEIDYFATSFNGKTYLIPVEECGADKKLRILPTKNGQVRGITWAKDYELEEVVKSW